MAQSESWNLRSDFLVHWTGKDISTRIKPLAKKHRGQYIKRLIDILTKGFWMTKPEEAIHGGNKSWITYEVDMTCFTEVRLSRANRHAEAYGLLGVGVDRKFILDRWGGPVHYVRNHEDEAIIRNLQAVYDHLKNISATDQATWLAMTIGFLKSMSTEQLDDFNFIEENEWRIIHFDDQVNRGNMIKTMLTRPAHRVRLQADDIRLIVFPDDDTRREAVQNKAISTWFNGNTPPLLTLQECAQF